MSTPLVATKLYVPPLRAELVSRPRLMGRLNAGLSGKLTLVSAPAGFGKTTLLTEWIRGGGEGVPPQAAAWVSLEPGDNDPARFWAYVFAALNTVQAAIADHALTLLRSPRPPPIEAVLTTIINALAAVPVPGTAERPAILLVLDDYHAIENGAIHQGLGFLLDHLPLQMHLVVSSRADPPLPLARWRAQGQLNELRIDDLRFTAGEAVQFLNEVMGLDLAPQAVSALENRTEGWIAGLQLAALSMRGRDAKHAGKLIETFSGSHRYILDYLLEEVLDQQPEDVQTFLLQTSILGRLCASLCHAVCFGVAETDNRSTGPAVAREHAARAVSISSSQTMLERLEAANLFIVPLDDERRWYRYHRLFADLLQAHLQERGPAAPLHRRAAVWYERHGLVAEAIDHALAAQDHGRAARLIGQGADEILWKRGEVITLLGWLEMLPEASIRSQPHLCLLHAWALFLGVQLEAAAARIQDAEQALLDAPISMESRQAAVDQIAVMEAMVANFRGDIPRTIELSHRALDLVPKDNLFLRGALAGNLGGAYSITGNLVGACKAFAEATRLYQASGNTFIALIAGSYLAGSQVALGQLREASRTYRQALEWADEGNAQHSLGALLTHVGLGSLQCERNELEAAAHHLRLGTEPGKQRADSTLGPGQVLLADGYLALARVQQAQGHAGAALDLVQKAEQAARAHAPAQLGHVAAARARLLVRQGRLEAARQWMQVSGLGAGDDVGYQREYEYLTLARVLVAEGRSEEAAELLERLRQAAEEGQRRAGVIEALMLQALAHKTGGREDKALATLEQALLLAEREGYVRLFADEGSPMEALLSSLNLLRDISHQPPTVGSGYVSRLLEAIPESSPGDPGRGVQPPTVEPGPALVQPLTERELEVLRLISDGLSNREIAERLVIALTTVKKHAGNIYGKLGVQSRTQAIAQARELGLLE